MRLLITEKGVLEHLKKKRGGTDSEDSIFFAVRGSMNVTYSAIAKLKQKGLVKRSRRKGEMFATLTAKGRAFPFDLRKGKILTWASFCRQLLRKPRK